MAILSGKLNIGSENLVTLDKLTDKKTGAYANNGTVFAAIYQPDIKHLNAVAAVAVHKLPFDAGDNEPAIGATLTGQSSGATAKVAGIEVTSGTWVGNDAAGNFWVTDWNSTAFTENEELRDNGTVIADVDAGWSAEQKTQFQLTAHGFVAGETGVRLEDTHEFDDHYTVEYVVDADKFVLDVAYNAETFGGDEDVYVAVANSLLTMPYEAASDGKYQGTWVDSLVLKEDVSYYVFVDAQKDDNTYLLRRKWKAVYP